MMNTALANVFLEAMSSQVFDGTIRQCYDYLSLTVDYEGQTKVEYLPDVS
jgi:hypothetical protein